jgi:hypothetical protein
VDSDSPLGCSELPGRAGVNKCWIASLRVDSTRLAMDLPAKAGARWDVCCHDEKVSSGADLSGGGGRSGRGDRDAGDDDGPAARPGPRSGRASGPHAPNWPNGPSAPATCAGSGPCPEPRSASRLARLATQRVFGPWNYWWQAHVLDCLVDAYVRSPDPAAASPRLALRQRRPPPQRQGLAQRLLRRHGLARPGPAASRAVRRRTQAGRDPAARHALKSGWTEDSGGGIWWRIRDKYDEDFKNVPTNGPAAILFARLRDQRAYETASWIEANLVDPQTGIVWDGLHVGSDGAIREIGEGRVHVLPGRLPGRVPGAGELGE